MQSMTASKASDRAGPRPSSSPTGAGDWGSQFLPFAVGPQGQQVHLCPRGPGERRGQQPDRAWAADQDLRLPGPAWAAEAARQGVATRLHQRPGPVIDCVRQPEQAGRAGTSTFSASAPGQPMIPTSRRSAQTCGWPLPAAVAVPAAEHGIPGHPAPSQPGSTPAPELAKTTPHHSWPGRIGKPILPWAK